MHFYKHRDLNLCDLEVEPFEMNNGVKASDAKATPLTSTQLQWGRILLDAEGGPAPCGRVRLLVASMGPRPFGRGRGAILALYHYLFWGSKGANIGVESVEESLQKLSQNPATLNDLKEVAEWNLATPSVVTEEIATPAKLPLRLHANYGLSEIKASFGLATVEKPGSMGVGVIHIEELRTYIHLVTFNKSDRDFEPTTLPKDYPISPRQLHWESNTQTSQESPTGQNYLHFQDRDYTILFFARYNKRTLGETTPFTFLGPAKQLLSYQGNNLIEMLWELQHPMPAQLFEQASSL